MLLKLQFLFCLILFLCLQRNFFPHKISVLQNVQGSCAHIYDFFCNVCEVNKFSAELFHSVSQIDFSCCCCCCYNNLIRYRLCQLLFSFLLILKTEPFYSFSVDDSNLLNVKYMLRCWLQAFMLQQMKGAPKEYVTNKVNK